MCDSYKSMGKVLLEYVPNTTGGDYYITKTSKQRRRAKSILTKIKYKKKRKREKTRKRAILSKREAQYIDNINNKNSNNNKKLKETINDDAMENDSRVMHIVRGTVVVIPSGGRRCIFG